MNGLWQKLLLIETKDLGLGSEKSQPCSCPEAVLGRTCFQCSSHLSESPTQRSVREPTGPPPQPCQHFWGPSQDSTSRERFRPSPQGPRIQFLTCKFQHTYEKGCHPLAMVLYFLGQRCILGAFFFFFFFCCMTRGILVAQPRIEPCPLQWKCGVSTTVPPGKSHEFWMAPNGGAV